jgi:hypothetical protein
LSAAGGVFTNDTNDHITFDMSQTDVSTATPSPTWSTVPAPPATSITLERRTAYEITTLDSNRYMVLGGGHFNNALLTPGAIFDATSKTWTGLTNPPYYM